jgi:hypothetical protein
VPTKAADAHTPFGRFPNLFVAPLTHGVETLEAIANRVHQGVAARARPLFGSGGHSLSRRQLARGRREGIVDARGRVGHDAAQQLLAHEVATQHR